jgi:hypothetical protein
VRESKHSGCRREVREVTWPYHDHGNLLHVYPHVALADAQAVTLRLSPPVHTKLSYIASRMVDQRDVEYNQMFPNACVLLDCP